MAIQRPARLEKNRHGVFAMRLVMPAAHRDADGRPRDIRISLRTRDPVRARVLALQLNAEIERLREDAPQIDPRQVLLRHQLQTREATGSATTAPEKLPSLAKIPTPSSTVDLVNEETTVSMPAALSAPSHSSPSTRLAPPTATKLTSLIKGFVQSRGTLAQNRRNTGLEKERSLTMLLKFLQQRKRDNEPASTADLTRANLIDFVGFYGAREGKRGAKSLSPRTVVKLVGHLREFADYLTARGELTESPMDTPFDRAIAGLQSRASQIKGRRNYRPFTEANIRSVFEPRGYLTHNSAADDFWVPLLGLFTGARLGELVTLTLADVTLDEVAGVQVLLLDGKNENSRRSVPVAQTLLDVGFLDYVEHVRRMGATELFPNRPMNPTREADPSKHASRAFGEHLDRLSLTDPLLVFHSFRHTAISRMHVCGVPVADAELIVGHAAQDAAVRSDAARSHAGRPSVHLGTYMHAESYSVAGEPVMARLKRRIDASLTFDLEIALLAKAAKIVSAHTKAVRTAGGKQVVRSGWHTNAKAVCERAVSSLDEADSL